MKMKNSRFPSLESGYDSIGSEVVAAPTPLGNSVTWRFWGMWVFVAVIALLIQLLTLDVLPHLQQDEAQITDFGRLALNPHSDWSITWWTAEGKPLVLWSYLGPLIAELSFQIGGPSGLGPRWASLIGGFMAATMALGWLVARRVPFYAAFGLSLAFMLDPLFVFSQRMARPDSWVLALCFACCWLLRETTNKDHSFERWHIMAAGGLAATAAFIWPSAVLIYPLIILELFQVAKAGKEVAYRNKYILSLVLYFTVGGLIFAVLLLLPIWQNLLIILNDMTTLLSQNVDPSKTSQDRFFSFFNIESWLTMMRTFRRAFSPVFPLLALAGIVLHREKGLILVFIVTLFIIFASRVYSLRVLYLLPYLLVLGSGIFIQSKESQSNLLKSLRIITLSVLLAWSVGISLLIRTALGLEGKSERNRDKIYQVAVSKIGKGNHNVFLGFTYEFYFVGRSLGWKLYTPYILYSNNEQGKWEMPYKPTPEFLKLLSKMDYVIIPKGTVTEKLDEQVARSNVELEKQLASSGLYFSSTFRLGEDGYQNRTKEFLLWLFQGRGLAFLQGKDSYGSYMLYARVKNGKSDKVSLSSR